MKYRSTRGGQTGVSFQDVLFAGYAPDGGLYVPEKIPSMSKEALEIHWSRLNYIDIVKEICSVFISKDEIDRDELHKLIEQAFSAFPDPQHPVGIMELIEANGEEGLVMLGELCHGPTMTFKDLGLSVSARFMEYFLNKSGKRATVLIGTSGDTGSAAIRAICPLKSTDIVVLLPRGLVTPIQERQMTTVIADNVHIYSVESTSDDLDEPIKDMFSDSSFVNEHSLCSLNSVNWARIVTQAAHFVYLYFEAAKRNRNADKVRMIVPTGACGNLAGGFLARKMLKPILEQCSWPEFTFVAAVGQNDIVHKTICDGSFALNERVIPTWSCAIDIQAPYNVERLLFLASDFDVKLTGDLMKEFEAERKVTIPKQLKAKLCETVEGSGSYSNKDIENCISKCFSKHGHRICPHTAVAYSYHCNHPVPKSVSTVIIATASAAKFPEALSASGVSPAKSEEIEKLMRMPTTFQTMDRGQDWSHILKNKIEDISKMRK